MTCSHLYSLRPPTHPDVSLPSHPFQLTKHILHEVECIPWCSAGVSMSTGLLATPGIYRNTWEYGLQVWIFVEILFYSPMSEIPWGEYCCVCIVDRKLELWKKGFRMVKCLKILSEAQWLFFSLWFNLSCSLVFFVICWFVQLNAKHVLAIINTFRQYNVSTKLCKWLGECLS